MKNEQAMLERLQGDIMKEKMQKHRETAQERMSKQGSKEIKHWLGEKNERPSMIYMESQGPACLAVKPLDLHLVNVGSIPTGPTHGEV